MQAGKLKVVWCCVALRVLGACSDFEIENKPPVAAVQVLMNGMVVETNEPIPFMGAPVTLTLDGSGSEDEDGRVVRFEWWKTAVAPVERYAGNGRVDSGVLPPFDGDPMAIRSPSLSLGEGEYQYSLWVTDDEGMISEPATVAFTIKTPVTYVPDAACKMTFVSEIAECVDCACTPNAMLGCYDEYAACYLNADSMFVALCKAIIDCSREKACIGDACFAADKCRTEITAGTSYMGAMACTGDRATDPCSAARELGACTSMGSCAAACN